MLTTAIIAFREFLEAFLLVGLFLGMNKKFHLGKQKEILFAALLGILFSLLLPLAVFFFASHVQHILTEKTADTLEGYFLMFSGFFLAYVVFSLHDFMKNGKKKTITNATEKMEQEIFDISLFFTIVFFISREGFEVAILIATTSLFSTFQTNVEGLLLGFLVASFIGFLTAFTYIKLPMKKIFFYTEFVIAIIGAAMVKNGVTLLLENYLSIHLEKYFSLPLSFLPNETTISGHTINNLFGLQQQTGIVQLVIMIMYMGMIWVLFKMDKSKLKFH